MTPKHSDFGASSNIPHYDIGFVSRNALNIETDGGNGCDGLAQFEFVENGGFTDSIHTQNYGSHLLFGEELEKKLSEVLTHVE